MRSRLGGARSVAAAFAICAVGSAQRATRPQFEVASIKACKDGSPISRSSSPGRAAFGCQTVQTLIQFAYILFADGHLDVSRYSPPIVGGPPWISSDRFQIVAKPEGKASQEMMRGPMLAALLEDRFKLSTHRESREAPIYPLTIAKRGTRLRPASCTIPDFTSGPVPPPGPRQTPLCGSGRRERNGLNTVWDVYGLNLDGFAHRLSGAVDRPVVDRTGIAGSFDFHLEWAADAGAPGAPEAAPSDPAGAPSIFTALQEQLGLKLVPARGPVEFLVIDHVERPSEN